MDGHEITFVCVGEIEFGADRPASLYVRKDAIGAGHMNTPEKDIELIKQELRKRKVLSDSAKLIQGAVERANTIIEIATKGE